MRERRGEEEGLGRQSRAEEREKKRKKGGKKRHMGSSAHLPIDVSPWVT